MRVLYVAYWGAAEPLGQSLILPALLGLASRGVRLTFVSFEKSRDADDPSVMREVRHWLEGAGIRWIPLRYHKRPRLPATAFDVAQGYARGIVAAHSSGVDIVHARTFMGGVIGRPLAATLRARFIYHNEGFYPDEQVDGGFWAEGSALHRTTRSLERGFYSGADGLIALSHRARAILEETPAVRLRGTPVIVVPSCVDLQRFTLGSGTGKLPEATARGGPIRFVYSGAVGGRYELDRVGSFLAVAAEELGPIRLKVLTRAEESLVVEMLTRGGLPRDLWSIGCLPHAAMPEELRRHQAGLFFLARGRSEHGCSPTKIGEYWACGIPVVTSPHVSDTDDIIARKRVGVVLADHSQGAYREAAGQLKSLLADPGLAMRCREAAEEYYALDPAVSRQVELYKRVLARA